ncbi:ABC transporter ATP-binding protein [Reinekea marina]|uniref:ABC transporter ATP-binding protein n=1 Tax=Reinekea marina TaxID=1310421 RepID=A0ABV7WMM2_9GAMM|nr:ABC transporter ATP-binding protein [Reinekea marina]MDN3650705.1 ABC transporter ATP-binding protein [Reinekea marina]
MNQQAFLEVKSLQFSKSGHTLLEDISFAIQTGELIGIIGPNGAGKSTLLKCMIEFYKKDAGHIRLNGKDTDSFNHNQRAQQMAYLSQYPESAFPFSVEETILLGANAALEAGKLSKLEAQTKAKQLANNLGIENLWSRKLTELSGGETQLVHFARILLQETPLVLLDEPTASLDIGHETQLMNLLRARCNQGTTTLVALHNLNTAAAFCDRLVLLDKGKLIAVNTPDEVITEQRICQLYDQPILVTPHPISGTITVLPKRIHN